MYSPILVIILTQILFTTSDILARKHMSHYGFTLHAFSSPWFIIYFFIRTIAMVGQLYVFSNIQLGRTSALFGAFSIVLSNTVGLLVLNEVLSTTSYIGVMLALTAFVLLAVGK